jgi:hypothetical protein
MMKKTQSGESILRIKLPLPEVSVVETLAHKKPPTQNTIFSSTDVL